LDTLPKLSSRKQLDFAIGIAQGVADVHNIDGEEIGPTLVHNDIHTDNIVVTIDNRPLLNDFNMAIPLMKHNETGETCPFHPYFTGFRSPEEILQPLVTEKAEIYALGNILYSLLVGPSWHSLLVGQQLKLVLERPALPARIAKSKDPRTRILIKAMYMCHKTNPKERPSAAEIVALLRKESEALS
jgi:serine/threonine protein kinase